MLACDPSWTAHHVAWIVTGMVPGGSTSRPTNLPSIESSATGGIRLSLHSYSPVARLWRR
jgi:hypothetical protein